MYPNFKVITILMKKNYKRQFETHNYHNFRFELIQLEYKKQTLTLKCLKISFMTTKSYYFKPNTYRVATKPRTLEKLGN